MKSLTTSEFGILCTCILDELISMLKPGDAGVQGSKDLEQYRDDANSYQW